MNDICDDVFYCIFLFIEYGELEDTIQLVCKRVQSIILERVRETKYKTLLKKLSKKDLYLLFRVFDRDGCKMCRIIYHTSFIECQTCNFKGCKKCKDDKYYKCPKCTLGYMCLIKQSLYEPCKPCAGGMCYICREYCCEECIYVAQSPYRLVCKLCRN